MTLTWEGGALIAVGLAVASGIYAIGKYIGTRQMNGAIGDITRQLYEMVVKMGVIQEACSDFKTSAKDLYAKYDHLNRETITRDECRDVRRQHLQDVSDRKES